MSHERHLTRAEQRDRERLNAIKAEHHAMSRYERLRHPKVAMGLAHAARVLESRIRERRRVNPDFPLYTDEYLDDAPAYQRLDIPYGDDGSLDDDAAAEDLTPTVDHY